ncbi:hypothetical protein [Sideroxydans lithotrophicus]|uniref:Uncharacterized protein n=1 Tax=Sideroxydans lithotrophicus (strain ES-1) TaxID=580332 RepID=D5CT62_SIDLE|nr:hypothetical protein [Sideroxydans lithotrophicus]ADE12148.1 hypothetical protein Slit_1919 [Sideroxydans lithotrophicus ES-1]
MTTFSTLAAMQLLTAEKAAVQAAGGYEDGQGMLSAINATIAEVKLQLTVLAANVPAGTNLTAINAALTALA